MNPSENIYTNNEASDLTYAAVQADAAMGADAALQADAAMGADAAVQADAASSLPSPDQAKQSMPSKCSYRDCITGKANTPGATPGKALFKFLMVGGMVTFMATFNGLQHSGLEFFAASHWMYPLIFCIAFLVRTFIGDFIVSRAAPRFIEPRFTGMARGISMTVLNVLSMAPFMGAIMTLLLNPPEQFFASYLSTLPLSFAFAVLINFFVVAPAVKIIYNNLVDSKTGVKLLQVAERDGLSWVTIFNN